jgi:hypothetical protein
VDANLILRAETLGIREIKLEGLIKEFGDDRVRDQIAVLERRAGNKSLRAVDNAFSYLRSLLRNEAEPDAPSGPVAAAPSLRVAPPAPPSPAQPAASDGSTWLREQIEAMKKEVAALEPAQLNRWVNRALQDLARKGALNAVISRRAAQGDVLHGLLGSAVVYAYADATYGPDWKVDRQLFDAPAGK